MRIFLAFMVMSMALYIFYLAIVYFIGSNKKKEEEINYDFNSIAVLICAKDEEKVIGNLIESLTLQDYPKDKYQLFVVAHNCHDKTIEIVKRNKVECLIYNDNINLRVNALKYGLAFINRKYAKHFDCFCVIDADNLVPSNFLSEMNKRFLKDVDVVSGYYGSKNLNDNLISQLAGLLYHDLMHLTCLVQNKINLPVNVYGSGYMCKMELKDELDKADTLVEDFELSILLVLKKKKLVMAPKAIFYAEMPTDLKQALLQRRRWSYGDKQCFRKYHHELFKNLFNLGLPGFKQYCDLLINPISILSIISILLGFLIYQKSFICISIILFGLFYFFFFLITVIVIKKEGLYLKNSFLTCLLEPFWIFITPLMAIVVLFYKDMQWIRTEKSSTIKIEELEKKRAV